MEKELCRYTKFNINICVYKVIFLFIYLFSIYLETFVEKYIVLFLNKYKMNLILFVLYILITNVLYKIS